MSLLRVSPGRRLYLREESTKPSPFSPQESAVWKVSSRKWKDIGPKEPPFGLPAAKLVAGEIDVEMRLDPMPSTSGEAGNVLREVRTQILPEMFDVSKPVCGTCIYLKWFSSPLRQVMFLELIVRRNPICFEYVDALFCTSLLYAKREKKRKKKEKERRRRRKKIEKMEGFRFKIELRFLLKRKKGLLIA